MEQEAQKTFELPSEYRHQTAMAMYTVTGCATGQLAVSLLEDGRSSLANVMFPLIALEQALPPIEPPMQTFRDLNCHKALYLCRLQFRERRRSAQMHDS